MNPRLRLLRSIVMMTAIAIGLPGLAVASDKDNREVSSYLLTEAGLAKFKKATENLAATPGACIDRDDDDSNSQSIDQMTAKIDATPGAKAAIQSAGMAPREYIVFMFSMMQSRMSAWALSQPGGKLPPGVSQANVDFYRKHEAAMAALGENDPCGDDSGD